MKPVPQTLTFGSAAGQRYSSGCAQRPGTSIYTLVGEVVLTSPFLSLKKSIRYSCSVLQFLGSVCSRDSTGDGFRSNAAKESIT